jgi:hypothetical protein
MNLLYQMLILKQKMADGVFYKKYIIKFNKNNNFIIINNIFYLVI